MLAIEELAALIRERNLLEERISEIIGRPASLGHLGEYIASQIFGISLAVNANQKGIDGIFEAGPLQGRTVNVKWYAKHEGTLDMCTEHGPEFYLVLCGPAEAASKSLGPRPWLIESVYLFDEQDIRGRITSKIGVATSVRKELWKENQVYPIQNSSLIQLSELQRDALGLFGSAKL